MTEGKTHALPYIIVWIFLSSCTILFNKWMLTTKEFHFPIFLTTCHMLIASICTFIIKKTTKLMESLEPGGAAADKITRAFYLKNIVPIGFFFAISLVFSNKTYLYLSVAFIQMLKAVTPMVILTLSFIFKLETISLRLVIVIAMVSFGVIIASYGEIHFVLIGVIFQILAILVESVRLIMVQILLGSSGVKLDPLSALYMFAPICFICNSVIFYIFEYQSFSIDYVTDIGVHIFILNGLVALALNISVVYLLKHTTSLVYTLSGVVKDIILILVSSIMFMTVITGIQAAGYSISMTGIILYNRIKLGYNINVNSFIQSVILACCICGSFYLISNYNQAYFSEKVQVDTEVEYHVGHKTCHWLSVGRQTPVPQNSDYAWVYSIGKMDPESTEETLKDILMSTRSLRHFKTKADIVLIAVDLDQSVYEKLWPLMWALQIRVVPISSPFSLHDIKVPEVQSTLSHSNHWQSFLSIGAYHLLEYDSVVHLNPGYLALEKVDELFNEKDGSFSRSLHDLCFSGPIVMDPSPSTFNEILRILKTENFFPVEPRDFKCESKDVNSLITFLLQSKEMAPLEGFDESLYNYQYMQPQRPRKSTEKPKAVQKFICDEQLDTSKNSELCEEVDNLVQSFRSMNEESLKAFSSKKIHIPMRLKILDPSPPQIPLSGIRSCDEIKL